MLPSRTRHDLVGRLRRIEGQTQGVRHMLADGRDRVANDMLRFLPYVWRRMDSVLWKY